MGPKVLKNHPFPSSPFHFLGLHTLQRSGATFTPKIKSIDGKGLGILEMAWEKVPMPLVKAKQWVHILNPSEPNSTYQLELLHIL